MEPSSNSTNVSLLLRVKDPENHDAWSRFDSKYRPMIVHFCRKRFTMTAEQADDAAQEVLVKLVRNMRGFEYNPKNSFRAWLSTVTRNSVVDGMRRKRPDRGAGGSDAVNRLANVPDADEGELADKLSFELRRSLFDECAGFVKERVTEQTWNAFTMLRSERPAAEVAEVLGMQVATVYRAKTRVLKLFREEVTLRLQARD